MTKANKEKIIPENSGRKMRQDGGPGVEQAVLDSGEESPLGRGREAGPRKSGRRFQVKQQGPPHVTLTIPLHRLSQGPLLATAHTDVLLLRSSSQLEPTPSSLCV